ncbi:unnamed protein product, partial [Callosobruchus maculatus]
MPAAASPQPAHQAQLIVLPASLHQTGAGSGGTLVNGVSVIDVSGALEQVAESSNDSNSGGGGGGGGGGGSESGSVVEDQQQQQRQSEAIAAAAAAQQAAHAHDV